jgi:hypothetical protein
LAGLLDKGGVIGGGRLAGFLHEHRNFFRTTSCLPARLRPSQELYRKALQNQAVMRHKPLILL